MDGIILIDKPKGWTSFDVVAKVRGIIKAELRKDNPSLKNVKVGHTGTLDPSATGLLVLCIGAYTKKVTEMIKHDKTYLVELTLGSVSTTGDQEGEINIRTDEAMPEEEVHRVLDSFIGEQLQTPPAFSAIKIEGKRAYDLARAGKEVKLEPRRVSIRSISGVSYSWPKLTFVCEVSSGTYIRSLATDVGDKLGCGAYMSELRRTRIDSFSLEDALSIEKLTVDSINEHLER